MHSEARKKYDSVISIMFAVVSQLKEYVCAKSGRGLGNTMTRKYDEPQKECSNKERKEISGRHVSPPGSIFYLKKKNLY